MAPPDLQVCVVRSASGGPSGRPKVLRGHRLVGRRLAVEAELLHQRVDLLAGHVAEWNSLQQDKGGVRAPGPATPLKLTSAPREAGALLPVLPLAGTLDALCRRVWGGRPAHARVGER